MRNESKDSHDESLQAAWFSSRSCRNQDSSLFKCILITPTHSSSVVAAINMRVQIGIYCRLRLILCAYVGVSIGNNMILAEQESNIISTVRSSDNLLCCVFFGMAFCNDL